MSKTRLNAKSDLEGNLTEQYLSENQQLPYNSQNKQDGELSETYQNMPDGRNPSVISSGGMSNP
jgi:hypothetical protein